MARKRRLESSDGLYHVINRGNYRADIFETEGAKQAVADDLARDRSLVRLEREDLAELNRSRWDSALGKCLELLGKNPSDAAGERLSAAWKLAIASKLKRESSVTNAWLSDRLNMGKPRSVSAICGKYAREREGACEWARRLNKLTIDH